MGALSCALSCRNAMTVAVPVGWLADTAGNSVTQTVHRAHRV
ncbi:hypothetical protein [Allokutzneria oryzae]